MSYVTVQTFECKCDHCGHSWRVRKSVLPTHCPGRDCTNPTAWNKNASIVPTKDYVDHMIEVFRAGPLESNKAFDTAMREADSNIELTDDWGA
jgi:hypothetical protein